MTALTADDITALNDFLTWKHQALELGCERIAATIEQTARGWLFGVYMHAFGECRLLNQYGSRVTLAEAIRTWLETAPPVEGLMRELERKTREEIERLQAKLAPPPAGPPLGEGIEAQVIS